MENNISNVFLFSIPYGLNFVFRFGQATPKESRKQLAPLDIKECTCTNEVGEDPKGKF
jgi:hypothetical protein